MTTSSITIDSEAVRAIVSKAIVDQLGEDQRQAVIAQAVEALLDEPKDHYGKTITPSPLALAFKDAVRQIAHDVVREYLAEDRVNQQVREQIVTKVKAMLDGEGGWLYSSIGFAVAQRVEEIMRGDR